uniref:Integral membrane protein 2 n=1 Tax=Lygus hesperus TaxID=30085 RepID=A0A0A9VZD7_LYGHE
MTIVTKPLSEKKNEKNTEPLVVEPISRAERGELVGGRVASACGRRDDSPRGRATSASTACLFLTALLVMSCGVITGLYLYYHFIRAQVHKYQGCFRIKLDEDFTLPAPEHLLTDDPAMLKLADDQMLSENSFPNYFREDFEIDDTYEKINVPDFNGGRHSKFIHDFKINKTGIVDVNGKKCFVMPLNRTEVLPPNTLLDLVKKMHNGYYEVNTGLLRETMKVVTPQIEDRSNLGTYIQRECSDYPIYRLEKFVSGVYKRSAEPEVKFIEFAGTTKQINIVNYAELLEHEDNVPRALA